jgi:hypothetical protein
MVQRRTALSSLRNKTFKALAVLGALYTVAPSRNGSVLRDISHLRFG